MKMSRPVATNRWLSSAVVMLLGGCLIVASIGCTQGPQRPADLPDLTPCTITVTHNGSPVEGADVLLSPKSGKFSAAGTTDASGKAVMKTNATYEGVAPGEYMATVKKLEKLDYVAPPRPEDPSKIFEWEEELKNQPQPKQLLPEKYGSFASSELTITIADGTPAAATFELTD